MKTQPGPKPANQSELRDLRHKLAWSQGKLAAWGFVAGHMRNPSQSTVSHWERGSLPSGPPKAMLKQLRALVAKKEGRS